MFFTDFFLFGQLSFFSKPKPKLSRVCDMIIKIDPVVIIANGLMTAKVNTEEYPDLFDVDFIHSNFDFEHTKAFFKPVTGTVNIPSKTYQAIKRLC